MSLKHCRLHLHCVYCIWVPYKLMCTLTHNSGITEPFRNANAEIMLAFTHNTFIYGISFLVQQMNDISINYELRIVIQAENGTMMAIYNSKLPKTNSIHAIFPLPHFLIAISLRLFELFGQRNVKISFTIWRIYGKSIGYHWVGTHYQHKTSLYAPTHFVNGNLARGWNKPFGIRGTSEFINYLKFEIRSKILKQSWMLFAHFSMYVFHKHSPRLLTSGWTITIRAFLWQHMKM